MRFLLGLVLGAAAMLTAAAYDLTSLNLEQLRLSVPEWLAHPDPSSLPDNLPQPPPEPAPPPPVSERVVMQPADPVDVPVQPSSDSTTRKQPIARGRQPVWTAFRSEASARGFARSMSTALDHPFAVKQLENRQFEVWFEYDSREQRDALLEQVRALTGIEGV